MERDITKMRGNVLYGKFSQSSSSLYSAQIGGAVTYLGRLQMQTFMNILGDADAQVIECDTDVSMNTGRLEAQSHAD